MPNTQMFFYLGTYLKVPFSRQTPARFANIKHNGTLLNKKGNKNSRICFRRN
jgi:hypothetical protein